MNCDLCGSETMSRDLKAVFPNDMQLAVRYGLRLPNKMKMVNAFMGVPVEYAEAQFEAKVRSDLSCWRLCHTCNAEVVKLIRDDADVVAPRPATPAIYVPPRQVMSRRTSLILLAVLLLVFALIVAANRSGVMTR